MSINQDYKSRAELKSLVDYCDVVTRPKLADLETQRLKIKRQRYIRISVCMAIFVTVVLCLGWLAKSPLLILNSLFVGGLLYVWFLLRGIDVLRQTAKAEIVSDIMSHLGWEYTLNFKNSADFDKLDYYGGFPRWQARRYEDKIAGEISDVSFTAYGVHLIHGGGEKQVNHDLFVIKIPSVDTFSGVTVIRARRSILDFNPMKFEPLKRVKFVSSQFEKLFDVYSSHGTEAQYLLPPNIIEEMTAFKQNLEGVLPDDNQIKIGIIAEELLRILPPDGQFEGGATLESITFMDNHVYIVLGESDFFKIDTSNVALHNPVHVDGMLAEIDLIHKVFDHLKVWIAPAD